MLVSCLFLASSLCLLLSLLCFMIFVYSLLLSLFVLCCFVWLAALSTSLAAHRHTANLYTKILDFGGFDSSRILTLTGGTPRPVGDFPESLSQGILVGIIFVARLGVPACLPTRPTQLPGCGMPRNPVEPPPGCDASL